MENNNFVKLIYCLFSRDDVFVKMIQPKKIPVYLIDQNIDKIRKDRHHSHLDIYIVKKLISSMFVMTRTLAKNVRIAI